MGTNTIIRQHYQQLSLNIWLVVTYKYANSEDSFYHKRGNSAIKELCCSPRQFSRNIWCCSATGWGVSRTFRSKSIQLFKIDETFLTQLIKCNKSEFWFSSWENFFANFVRVSECCLLKIVLVGWSILIICKQSLRIQLSVCLNLFFAVQDSSIADLVSQ